MKIRYFKSMEARRKRRSNERDLRRYEYKVRVAKWHKKFAWRPVKISTPNDDNEHSTMVWFETVMQKGRVVNEYGLPQFDKTVWTRYPEKEYFRKKLDGTLEKEETFKGYEDFIHDGTDMNISFQGGMGAGTTTPTIKPTKISGPSVGPPR